MKYSTIYRTRDLKEISGIKELLIREQITYRILNDDNDPDTEDSKLSSTESQIQVEENQREKAGKLLKDSGYTTSDPVRPIHRSTVPDPRAKPMVGKWVIFVLVALVVLIAIILFAWFMMPE